MSTKREKWRWREEEEKKFKKNVFEKRKLYRFFAKEKEGELGETLVFLLVPPPSRSTS